MNPLDGVDPFKPSCDRSTMSLHHETLPPELWLEIFEHLDERSYTGIYAPFQPPAGAGDVMSAYPAVVLVCRNWHDWAISFLYRNVKFPDSDSIWADKHPEYGRWVRRVVIPDSTATEIIGHVSPTEMLCICPNITVLVRRHPRPVKFDINAPCPLPSLKRLDWCSYGEDGSIHAFPAVLCAAPNLEYLSMQGYGRFWHYTAKKMRLLSLRTLHLGIVSVELLQSVSQWSLPALDTLIMDVPLNMSLVWAAHGSHIETIELGRENSFLHARYLMCCLQNCPALRKLNYYLFMTALPTEDAGSYPSVTFVGMHMAPDPELSREEWGHLEQHILTLAGGLFPNLLRLTFYGTPEQMLSDERSAVVLKPLTDRGCALEIVA
ncbi:hypothetical protein C8F04DRAFT_1108893 [Mycena alexandri]|uniref:F-box domain-containing protein n=1 Tax=Mycena alexandri TaxID=1745969 RepID=A0AAD6SUG6_9AGAR|nr:hypothetical protein C8F04DRAFT_1108893 [Mycena alexandri]